MLEVYFSNMKETKVHIEDMREEVLRRVKETDNHTLICRAYETITGKCVSHKSEEEEIKIVLS